MKQRRWTADEKLATVKASKRNGLLLIYAVSISQTLDGGDGGTNFLREAKGL